MNSQNIADIRQDYTRQSLDVSDVQADPIAQFEQWFQEALQAEVLEANAMHLATADQAGRPSGRIVLLKGIEKGGFSFFSNYDSQKGQELSSNPYAQLTFFWAELERQVRIFGKIEKLPEEESTAYFHSRPRNSQLGAWTSPQSQVIPDRSVLEQGFEELSQAYEGKEIPKPEHWGGYRLTPESLEFWQGRPSRLHDRIRYMREADAWKIERLAP